MCSRPFYIVLMLCLTCVLVLSGAPRNTSAENRGILTQIVLRPGAGYMVVDEMDGVRARYRTMANSDFYGEFSCAGFVKTYYETVYGVFVDNLTDLGPPRGRSIHEGSVPTREIFIQVDVPQKGDIIFNPKPPARNNHSAIVKSFDGELITLIEQNFKWAQDGGTYTWYNRTIPYVHNNNNYQIWRLSHIPQAPLQPPIHGESEPPLMLFPPFEDEPPTHTPPPAPPLSPDTGDDFFVDDSPIIFEVVIGQGPPVLVAEPEPEAVIEPEPTDPQHMFTHEVVVTIGSLVIMLNDTPLLIHAPPYIENNRTMLPVRYVSYALGLMPNDLVWDEASRSVTVYHKGDQIRFTIDSEVIFINGRPMVMDCASVLNEGVTYLPVRYLAEALGVFFEWDAEAAAVRFFY